MRYCYRSQILPGKAQAVRDHWKSKEKSHDLAAETAFWEHLKMTGFECWIQGTSMIHCLEGESLHQIFKGLREQIADKNPIALQLQEFYLAVLGKNYQEPEVEPQIECLQEYSLPTSLPFIKRGFFYTLRPDKEEEYRQYYTTSKKEVYEAMMRAFGVSHLATWLQTTPEEKVIVIYSERTPETPETSSERLKQGEGSSAWEEIAASLCYFTGLKQDELSPQSEWLTQ